MYFDTCLMNCTQIINFVQLNICAVWYSSVLEIRTYVHTIIPYIIMYMAHYAIYMHTVPLKGNVALAHHSMLEARKLDTLYSC